MRRIDRILSNALGGSKHDSNKSDDMDDDKVPLEAIACNNKKNEHNFCDSCNNDSDLDTNAISTIDLESPVAPLFSPLTPYINKKPTYNTTNYNNFEMSSPLRPMSPSTLELLQNLTGEQSPSEVNVVDKFLENNENNIEVQQSSSEVDVDNLLENKDNIIEVTETDCLRKLNNEAIGTQIGDFGSDTDSDFIPNSDENTSDEEDLGTPRHLRVAALVHSSKKQITDNEVPPTLTEIDINVEEVINNSDMIECESNNETRNDDNVQNEAENFSSEGRPKKGRKRKYPDHTIAQTKERKYLNLPYHSKKKHITSKKFQDYTCSCLKQCNQIIAREKREEEFQKYISLGSYEAQLLYILNNVKEIPKTRSYTVTKENKTNKKRPREYSRKYTICKIEVCRPMFLNTFQITTKKIDVCLRKNRNGNAIKDRRGLSQGGWNKTQQEDIDFVKDIISSLPKYESHYRREQSNGVMYLKLGMTIQKIYDIYLEKFGNVYGSSKNPLSLATVKRIFYKYFNLHCKSLKKDTCTRCDTFTNKIRNCSSDEEKEKFEHEKESHLKKAEDLRKCMKEDLAKAKTDEEFECLTFDLEKTLPLPRIPTSIVFYKRQLWLYNCGIHAGSNDTGHCYVWVEGEAGRGAQEVGSCLINFIKNKLDSKVKHLVLWSDCCGGQNRNIKIVMMLKTVLNSHHTLKTITFKYLESGHTFLPNDTDFSKIESQLKFHQRIYTADDYMQVIRSCKRKNPLEVKKMVKEDFLSSKNIEKNIVNRKTFINKQKTNWLQTKVISLKKEEKYIIYMKSDIHEDQYYELNIQKKTKGKSFDFSERDFTVLWPIGKKIAQPKLDDLRSMFHLIPKDCLDFYKSLEGDENIEDDLEGFSGQPDFHIEYESQEE